MLRITICPIGVCYTDIDIDTIIRPMSFFFEQLMRCFLV